MNSCLLLCFFHVFFFFYFQELSMCSINVLPIYLIIHFLHKFQRRTEASLLELKMKTALVPTVKDVKKNVFSYILVVFLLIFITTYSIILKKEKKNNSQIFLTRSWCIYYESKQLLVKHSSFQIVTVISRYMYSSYYHM